MTHSVIFCGYSKVRFGTKPAGAYVVANIFRSKLDTIKRLVDKFVDSETKFVCLSTTLLGPPGTVINVLSSCDKLFEPIMQYIKSINPNIIFVIGGSKITRNEKSSLPFDYYIKGQAESALRALILHIMRGDPLVMAGNVISDKVYGFDSFNSSDLLKFTEDDVVFENETLPIELGRGCVFKCAFCDYDMTGKNFGDYNKTEEVFYSILMSNYEKFGTTRYQFSDDTLNDSAEKIDLLCRVSKRLPFKLEYGAYLRVELLDKIPDSAERLLESGLRGANFGIETFNKKAGASVGKGYGMHAVSTLTSARKVWRDNVAVNINLIVGLPYDTISDLQEQHRMIRDADFIDYVFYTPLAIPKVGDSLFSTGLHKRYYREMIKLHDVFLENIQKYEATATFFNENVHWETDDMSVCDAILLAREFQDDFIQHRPNVVNNVTAFCIMSMLENFTMDELRNLNYTELDARFSEITRTKIARYIRELEYKDIKVTGVFDTTQPVIVPGSVFTSKLTASPTYIQINKE
jgi:radical SAM superfamily enzyme YgiQ (UPF0313 family)